MCPKNQVIFVLLSDLLLKINNIQEVLLVMQQLRLTKLQKQQKLFQKIICIKIFNTKYLFIQIYFYLLHWIIDSQKPQYVESNNVNLLHHIVNKIKGYIEKSNEKSYFVLVPTEKSKYPLKALKLLNKIRGLVKLITENLGNYDEKYIKIKFKSIDDLLLKNVRTS